MTWYLEPTGLPDRGDEEDEVRRDAVEPSHGGGFEDGSVEGSALLGEPRDTIPFFPNRSRR